MSESSDDSVDSVIAVHDHRRLHPASISSSAPIEHTIQKDFPKNKPVSKPAPLHSKVITATSTAIPDTQIKGTKTNIRTSEPDLKNVQAIVISTQEASDCNTNRQIKEELDTVIKALDDSTGDSNTKLKRKRRGRKASKSVSKKEIESVPGNSDLDENKEQTPYLLSCETKRKSQVSDQKTTSEHPQSVTLDNPNEHKHGTKLVSDKSTHLNAASKERYVQESNITGANKEKVDTDEMGNRFSSEKTKLGKEQEGKQRIKESKKKGKGKTSKSPASDRESSVGNRSSIETTDSYSSAATLVATANAAVGRRSPKKSPRIIPRSGVKLRDVISSDDESFISAGFRTPQATTPLLKRAIDPSSPSQRLLEFGKNIEREITEKFTNRSPTDQNKKAIKNKQWSSDNQQTGKVNTDSSAASIPDKLYSSLPKRCSRDGTVETDSDSFAMFENTERLYTSLPKDYYPIDDNLSDDVFMSCIDLAANSPDIPSRSQVSRNSVAQQSSPASTKKDLLAKQQRSPIPASRHISPPQSRKTPFGISTNPSDVSIPSGASRIFTNTNKSPNNPIQTHQKTTEEPKAPRSQKLLKTSGIRQDGSSSNNSPNISKRIIGDLSKSPGQTTYGQAYNSTSVVESPSAHSPGTPKSMVVDVSRSPKTSKRSQKNGSKSPASQHRIYGRGSESPTCKQYSQVDLKSPTIQKSKHDDTSKSPTIQRPPQTDSSKSPTTQRSPQIDSSISPTTQRRFQTDPSYSPTLSHRQQISKSPKTPKREMSSKSSTAHKRPPDESSRSPQIPRRRQVEGSVSPKVPKRHQKDGSLSPGFSRRIGNEISISPLQQRKDHEPALYCTINKPGKETSVTAVAQTTNAVNVSSFPSCARAEEESSQIQDSPKAQKQDKVLIAIAKKEHLRSTYDNVPDSDDSMVYFTSKNDPVFFEDNCVSEEIIATEKTPLHYKAEEPKKLGIEILKTPSKAKIECVFLERETRIPVADKQEKNPTSISLSEPKVQIQKKDTQKTIVTQTFQNSNLGQSHKSNANTIAPQASTSTTAQVACTPIQVTDQVVKQNDVPTEHLTKRQIRRRNKKKNLQMVGKSSLDSGSDAPLSPHAVVPTDILPLSTSDITKEATRDLASEMETDDKQHDCNVAGILKSKTDSNKSPESNISIKACNVLSQNKNDSVIITSDNVTVLPGKAHVQNGKSQIKNNSDTCDHVPPPSPLAVDTLNEIAEEDEETEEVTNAFIDEKAQEVLAFGDSVFKRLSSLVESQGDDNELSKRYRCGFDEDTEEVSDDFGDKKSCLVVLDELCNMGDKFKQETETIQITNMALENDIPQISESDIIESSNHKSEIHCCVQKRPSIPCELQLNTKSDTHDVQLDNEIKTTSATEPKRDSQQITEVINSYSDDITPTSHSYPENFLPPDVSTWIPHKPEIELREPESSSDEDFHSPMRKFSGDAFKVPAIEETFSELMSVKNILQDMEDKTPTSEVLPRFFGPDGMTSPLSHLNGSGRRSRMSPAITERTESELDMSEQLDNVSISTDSMYADDEDDGSEIIFNKTYTEDKGGEGLVSYTFYNRTHDYDSDEFWAESSAAEENYKVLENSANQASCTFKKARSEMHDIQRHLQDLRRQMEYLQDDVQGTSLTPSLSLCSSEWRPITE